MDLGDPTLLGVAAIVSAFGGVVSTVVGARRSRRDERAKAEQECFERLKATRAEAEALARELHEIKMQGYG